MNNRITIKGDRVIWMVVLLLAAISLLSVFSSSQAIALSGGGNRTFGMLMKQIFILILGISIVVGVHRIPYSAFSNLSRILIILTIPALILTLILGKGNAGAMRWWELPGGLTIQTSDFAKVVLITYIARILSLNQEDTGNRKEVYIPIIVPLGLICAFILPANFSTAAILFLTSMVLMFIGRLPFKYLLMTAGGAVALFLIYILIIELFNIESRKQTWENRWSSFRNQTEEHVNNYQVNRAKVAIVNGGIFGKGPGNSVQKEKLPQANSDFIFAIIVEEYGLIGGVIVIFLYLWLLFRTALIVRNSRKTFPALVALGLGLQISIQAILNMAVAVNLVPVTGQTLPYISSGGSSVLFTSVALGIILSTSWGINEEKSKQKV